MGAVIFLTGESYLNFGVLGFLIVPGLSVFVLARLHRKAYTADSQSRLRLLYYVAAVCLVQVWRDGLSSFVTFGVIGFLPCLLAVAIPGSETTTREACTPSVLKRRAGPEDVTRQGV